MNSKIKSFLKNKLHSFLKDKEILDIIVFGSAVKGKALPRDYDVAFITNKKVNISDEKIHISLISPDEFFTKTPSLVTTLLREGYSLKKDISLAEKMRFKNKVLFTYNLVKNKPSNKVRFVQIVRGKNKKPGLVEQCGGEWLGPQVFIIPIESEHLLDKTLMHAKVPYKKKYVLIH